MKDPWQVEQWHAKAKQHETILELEKPEKIWRRRDRGMEEWMTPLRNGDGLMLSVGENPRLSVFGPRFTRSRRLRGGEIPAFPTISCPLFDGVFAILDDYEEEVIQTLTIHDAISDKPGENSIKIGFEFISSMAAVNLDDGVALIVMGNNSGDLLLIRYQNGVLKRQETIVRVHEDSIFDVVSYGHRFCVTSDDGLVTAWDANSRNLIGRIKNPRLVDVVMNRDHILTDIDSVLRVYENKPGLKLKWVVRLPLFGASIVFAMYEPLTSEIGMLHDEDFGITFFDLQFGTPIFRIKSPFKAVNCFSVLSDATLFLTSSEQRDGHAIIRVTKPERVYEALCEFVRNNYTVTVGDKRVMDKERKWGKLFCIASAIVGGVKLGRNLLKIK